MIKKWIVITVLVQLSCFLIYAEETKGNATQTPPDSSQNVPAETTEMSDTEKDTVKTQEMKKEQKESKKKEKKKSDDTMTKKAHESMLVGGTKHNHGFPRKKRSKGKNPLKPQTICPMMGGAIDKNVYYDYNGMRVYFCCEGCIYSFKRAPRMFLKTLKRYGEKPVKIPKSQ